MKTLFRTSKNNSTQEKGQVVVEGWSLFSKYNSNWDNLNFQDR